MDDEKVTLVELLTEHEFFDDPAVCGCGEIQGHSDKDSWQWWIGHVQQAIGERLIALTVTLLPVCDWAVGSYEDTTGGTG